MVENYMKFKWAFSVEIISKYYCWVNDIKVKSFAVASSAFYTEELNLDAFIGHLDDCSIELHITVIKMTDQSMKEQLA